MFTGIIEEIGTLRSLRSGGVSAVLSIAARKILTDIKVGDSIAVNGICLTVTGFTTTDFTADIMPETLRRSALAGLSGGARLNLERALPVGGRFGGHLVSGHSDGVGVIRAITREDNAYWYRVRTSPEILRYIIRKGSIALDGISLTVAAVTDSDFSVSVIPHTAAQTNLGQRRVGDRVNLENDCVGKYIEKLLRLTKEEHDEAI